MKSILISRIAGKYAFARINQNFPQIALNPTMKRLHNLQQSFLNAGAKKINVYLPFKNKKKCRNKGKWLNSNLLKQILAAKI
ncbi:hypothetical protein CU633_13535 [Bacillus sp. V3-13]|uniref:hypothetical protein n=1 Tax=Bacillus sp. V3-13 TaxID=2053728 RepID=UPI000C79466E|nr:hypothetical protein [Bacillus sp. V3-13]PLR76922.1 hypothetical protein CU633_13535 [Bacillus sp. V3-13]